MNARSGDLDRPGADEPRGSALRDDQSEVA
jgi:hypothetical protein